MGVDFDVLFLKFANLEDKVHYLMFVILHEGLVKMSYERLVFVKMKYHAICEI